MSGVVITSDPDRRMHSHDGEESDLLIDLHDEYGIIEGKHIRLQVVASTHSLTIFPITR